MCRLDCPHLKACGGCAFGKWSYAETLREKENQVRQLLRPFCRVEGIEGMDAPFHYRNKVHVCVGRGRDGGIVTGIYARDSHRIVPVQSCAIHDRKADETIGVIRQLAQDFSIEPYDEDRGTGLLRHILIRTAHATGEMLVTLVIGKPAFANRSAFVSALVRRCPWVRTVAVSLNGQHTSMILGKSTRTVYGPGYIEDTLLGMRFALGPDSFYQVNPAQTEKLYAKALSLSGLTGTETAVDAYCGIGTIGLCASGQAGRVIGVEVNENAVRDAVHNARRNGVTNASFIAADAAAWMRGPGREVKADVVFMDPPRAGSSESFLFSLLRMRPKRIVYISCNPVTLARDLKILTRQYRAEAAYPFDLFPWTEHVETVCYLYHQKKEFISVPYEPKDVK